ncbi:hypothetical protein L202_01476 [Cryptococcus amylolentus CBS 6039]|uniref:Uncharacterized protein n=1 Tax=Cryptococcus amylolentus CBS 6039 TaxID=1295533 RepID=A0A1E3I419_9TREE|nr:hypothetical protein L202_01476 [Cryptococcus amylolentus CBS 6039]ODN83309.1 hypothetical protein L202_01476 [Cryptococcus amylolentus CBS 6039]
MFPPLPATCCPAPSGTLADWMGSAQFTDPKIWEKVWIEPTDQRYIRAWNTGRVVFFQNPDMLSGLSHSLSKLRLDAAVTDHSYLSVWNKPRLNPVSPVRVKSATQYGFCLEEGLIGLVNDVLSEYTLEPEGGAVTSQWKPEKDRVGPDFLLCTRDRLAQDDGFGLAVEGGETRLVGYLAEVSEEDAEEIRLFITEVVDRMHSRGSSSLFITDGQRFLVVQRLPDLDDPKAFHLNLSSLIGNAGPLDLYTPPDDLSPIHSPKFLTELPVGLLCSLSFETPLDPFPLPARSSLSSPDFLINERKGNKDQDTGKRREYPIDASFCRETERGQGTIYLSGNIEARPDMLVHSYSLALRNEYLSGPLSPQTATLPCPAPSQSSTSIQDAIPGLPGSDAISGLHIIEPIGLGHLWDTFLATLTVAEDGLFEGLEAGQEATVVAKITCQSSYNGYPPDLSPDAAREAILNEYRIYSTSLQHLQGSVVPKCYGVWGGVLRAESQWDIEREIWVMLMEHAGEALELEDFFEVVGGKNGPSIRREILKCYEQLTP